MLFRYLCFQLELGENRIMSGLQSLQGSPKLTNLSLSNNRIKDLETLEPLVGKNFNLLFVISLYGLTCVEALILLKQKFCLRSACFVFWSPVISVSSYTYFVSFTVKTAKFKKFGFAKLWGNDDRRLQSRNIQDDTILEVSWRLW